MTMILDCLPFHELSNLYGKNDPEYSNIWMFTFLTGFKLNVTVISVKLSYNIFESLSFSVCSISLLKGTFQKWITRTNFKYSNGNSFEMFYCCFNLVFKQVWEMFIIRTCFFCYSNQFNTCDVGLSRPCSIFAYRCTLK